MDTKFRPFIYVAKQIILIFTVAEKCDSIASIIQ